MFTTKLLRTLTRVTARSLHTTSIIKSTTELTMPALSPTMTEGSVTEWKFKVGDSFVAGDVLLQIETDKASIEVEAQDDGILGMILVENDTAGVQVGAVIALLIEDGDDISALKAPSASTSSSIPSPPTPAPAPVLSPPTPSVSTPSPQASTSTPSAPSSSSPSSSIINLTHPSHPLPLLPSVNRLLVLNNIKDASVIKATGFKGGLTKGDVLEFLGKIEKRVERVENKVEKIEEKKVEKKVEALDGASIRRLIAAGLSSSSKKSTKADSAPAFDDILDEYLPISMRSKPSKANSIPGKEKKNNFDNFLDL